MWKKKIKAIIMTMVFVITGVSCGDTDSKNNEKLDILDSYNPYEEVTLNISWWGGDDRHEKTQQAIELFEKKNPNIHVETDYGAWSGWKNKIFGQYANGECADVMQVNYDWLVSLSFDGSGFFNLEQLSDFIKLENFSDDVLAFGRRNGILNAIPVSITGRSLFYNLETYQKASAELPQTWDDLFEVAPKLNEIGCYPLNLDIGSGFTAFYLAIAYEQQKTGKQFITENEEIGFSIEELADALKFYKELQDKGVIRSVEQMKAEDTSSSLYESDTWVNGEIGGILEWGSSVSKYEKSLENPENLVMGPLLTMPNAKNTGFFYKPSLLFAINKDTKYPIQSAMLLNFLYNDPEAIEILGTSRGIPVSKTAVNVLEENGMLNGLAYESNNQILSSNPVLISPYMENSLMQDFYTSAIESVSMELLNPIEAATGLYGNISYTLDSIKRGRESK